MDSLTVQADLEALEPISQYILAAANIAGLGENSSYKLRLAVDEIVTNIIEHGYAGAIEPGLIGMQAQIEPEALVIQIEDKGRPFDLRQARQPDLKLSRRERSVGGLGIYLALLNIDQVLYERVAGCNRNRLIVKLDADKVA